MNIFNTPGADAAYDRWHEPPSQNEVEIKETKRIAHPVTVCQPCWWQKESIPARFTIKVGIENKEGGTDYDVCEEHEQFPEVVFQHFYYREILE